jgi:CHAT domain-containing protein
MTATAMPKHPGGCRLALLLSAITLSAIALSVSGCQSKGTRKGEEGALFQVGQNAIGEPCRVQASVADAQAPAGVAAYNVLCGTWQQPSARIYRSAGPAAGQQVTAGWWRDRLDGMARCEAPVATQVLDGTPASALDCALLSGGWPYQALAVTVGDTTFLVDSIPVAYAPAERAVGVLSGRTRAESAGDVGRLSAEMGRLEARLAASPYSAGDVSTFRNLLRLGQYNNLLGQHAEAEVRYRQALALQERAAPDDRTMLAPLYMHLALELSNQERFAEAGAMFVRAEENIGYAIEPTAEATLISYEAIHLANQGRAAESEVLAARATEMRRGLAAQAPAAGPGSAAMPGLVTPGGRRGAAPPPASRDVFASGLETAQGDIAQSRYTEAAMLVRQGRVDEAEQALADAETALAQSPQAPPHWAPRIQVAKARIAELKGDHAQAAQFYASGAEAQRALFGGSRSEGQALIGLGGAHAAQGRTAEALVAYRSGFAIIKKTGGSVRADDVIPYLRLALAEAERSPTSGASVAEEMFEVAQMTSGSLTAEAMARTAARLSASEEKIGDLIRQLEDSRRKRDLALQAVSAARSSETALAPQIEASDRQLAALEERIADLERQVQIAAPRYNQLIDTPVSSGDVRSVLKPGEAMVQVLLGSQGGFGFHVTSGNVTPYDIALTSQKAAEMVGVLRSPLDAGTDKIPNFDVAAAHDLYKLVLGPVAQRLAGVDHLITVPSGPLLSLPFALLVTDRPPALRGTDHSRTAWLVRRHALTLAPSVQSFVNLRKIVQASSAPRSFIGFGDFRPHGDGARMREALKLSDACSEIANLIARLPPLPGTADELRLIVQAIRAPDARLVQGTDFTEAALRREALKDYRVVYFATHAVLPSQLDCIPEPFLTATPTPDSDGIVFSSEVAELKLNADLVVLSACNTGGSAARTGGESLSGFARSFLYAGARSLIVTHWEIPDRETVGVMQGTFDRVSGGALPYAEALRQGQLALLDRPATSHPYFWGAFTLVGDGGQRLGGRSTASAAPVTVTPETAAAGILR